MHHDIDAVGQLFNQLRGSVFSADVQRDAASTQACGEGFQIIFGRWHVEQDDVGTVTGQGLGNGCADAPRCPGDQCLASGQRSRPVRHGRIAGGQANHLPGDERAFR
ncbi:hypothetical protein D3C87_1838390 [compost metagenome]